MLRNLIKDLISTKDYSQFFISLHVKKIEFIICVFQQILFKKFHNLKNIIFFHNFYMLKNLISIEDSSQFLISITR